MLPVSDRELRNPLSLAAIHKRSRPRNTTPQFLRWELGRRERAGREEGGGRKGRGITAGVGRRNRRETEGDRNRARTNTDKTCHNFSKQDQVETHAKAQREDSV